MKQILQSLKDGRTELAEVPMPAVGPGQILIRTEVSLVSTGTERSLVEFGKAGWIEKARQQPDKVRMVLEKAATDGFVATYRAVNSKLDQPISLGYCNVGKVLEVGAEVTGVRPGDRVVSNGKHAEWVSMPKNLCALIPATVSDESAAFAVLGAIGLQGLRLASPTLGETVVVMGLGLIGLLTVQLARAQGCRVLGMDFDTHKCELARRWGAEIVDLSRGADPLASAMEFTRGQGVDAVLITAATSSNEPVHQAAQMSRKRGRIVLVGVVGLELSRADFYEKELSFQVSCSYGPGRYDPEYEEHGRDYPIGFVRWTLRRNFEAVLGLMESGRLDVIPLISHRIPFAQAHEAYELVSSGKGLGIVLQYGSGENLEAAPASMRTVSLDAPRAAAVPSVVVGVMGAGNFAGQVLLPALARCGARLKSIVSNGGVTGTHWGRKFGFEQSSTESRTVLADPEINLVLIATRHESHARLVTQALAAGKRVYVEKPLCLNRTELNDIQAAYSAARCPFLMVGFNRRFASHTVKLRSLLAVRSENKAFVMMVNAGAIPGNHWTQDGRAGGGRILGEACHYIDLLRHLAGAPITRASIDYAEGVASASRDVASLHLSFADGSIGSIHYLSNGSKSFPKERLEVFCGGGILQLDNFRSLRGFGWKGFRRDHRWVQDKGHGAEMEALIRSVRDGKESPIAYDEIFEVAEVSIALAAGEAYRRPRS